MNKLGIAERVITRRAARKLLDGSYLLARRMYGDTKPGPGRHQVCSVGAVILASRELGCDELKTDPSYQVQHFAEGLFRRDNKGLGPENNVLTHFNDVFAEGAEDAARMLYMLSVAEVR